MLFLKYIKDWDFALSAPRNYLKESENIQLISYQQKELGLVAAKFPDFFYFIGRVDVQYHSYTRSQMAHSLLSEIASFLEKDGTLSGLLKAECCDGMGLSPFAATGDYCISIKEVRLDGGCIINVSPIYHLGVDYPEIYRKQYGEELDKGAILGLIEIPLDEELEQPANYFHYGIDAGVVFKSEKISHNVTMSIGLSLNINGIQAMLRCGQSVTCLPLTWDKLGIMGESCLGDRVGQL